MHQFIFIFIICLVIKSAKQCNSCKMILEISQKISLTSLKANMSLKKVYL